MREVMDEVYLNDAPLRDSVRHCVTCMHARYIRVSTRTRTPTGNLSHKKVMSSLELFDGTLAQLETGLDRIARAKAALEMKVSDDYRLTPIRGELKGLQNVWATLSTYWQTIDELKEKVFTAIKPLDVRRALNEVQQSIHQLQPAMRTYEATEYLKKVIRDLLACNHVLGELSSGILRAKHKKQILKLLKLKGQWRELTVGSLWESKPKQHLKGIRAILEQAQGESALEEFLGELAVSWEQTKFELVDYRGKCYLIRNFAALFQSLADHLGDLQSMKQSPFFKSFEQEALHWEHKLNQAQGVSDVFIEVCLCSASVCLCVCLCLFVCEYASEYFYGHLDVSKCMHGFGLLSFNISTLRAALYSYVYRYNAVIHTRRTRAYIHTQVQRRWVYLEGIFNNSQDVQVQLAYQYKKFRTFDREFIRMMREIKREDTVDYWIKDERNMIQRLEGYLDTLNNIQKALGLYLEKQRAAFPRFYFVGDEDLLEIIGTYKVLRTIDTTMRMYMGICGRGTLYVSTCLPLTSCGKCTHLMHHPSLALAFIVSSIHLLIYTNVCLHIHCR